VTAVHQLLSGAGPHDAITTEALVFRRYFSGWGWGGSDHAFRIAPGLGGRIASADRLSMQPEDVLLLHHSAGWPQLEKLLALPNPKLLLYHNVTPPHWLWEYAPMVAAHCAAGREQLHQLARAAEQTAADSAFNASELGVEGTIVIPLLVERDTLGAPAASSDPARPPHILFVGRLSPHKRQDELIRVFALYRRHRAPDARLTLVGDPISDAFVAMLRGLAGALAPGAVRIQSGLDATALGECYRDATAFLCMSEHEGFCIPLTEAFHFGVPVIARPFGAVPEVVGDAGLLVDDSDPAVISEVLHLIHQDAELRAELRRRGRERLHAYEPDAIAPKLRSAVEATLAARRTGSRGGSPPGGSGDAVAAAVTT
jgi:glycosyltransferase involved in cell wall biosynthesis